MSAEDHHVFAAGAGVLLAPGAQFQQLADHPLLHFPRQRDDGGRESHLVGDGNAALGFIRQREHLVGLPGRGGDWLLHDQVRAGA